jgi:hypothetical protein
MAGLFRVIISGGSHTSGKELNFERPLRFSSHIINMTTNTRERLQSELWTTSTTNEPGTQM